MMENETIHYYNGISARPSEVRVLVFNESLNIYEAYDDLIISSFPLKGATANLTGEHYFIYPENNSGAYLQLKHDHPQTGKLLSDIEYHNGTWYKKLIRQRLAVLVTFMIALVVGLYLLIVNLVPFIGSKIITTESEIEMGNNLKAMMIEEEKLIGAEIDSAGTLKLQAFANKLKLSKEYPIRLTLLKSKTVNAYALPGGQVVVYSGMLDKISRPETLVALLAHESTHVNERHTLRSLLRSAANGIILSIIFNDASGVSAAVVSNAETLNGLSYSRSLEEEADSKGMELMIENGVNADGMRELMKLLKEEGDVPENLSFLSTHPLTESRIKAANEFIRNNPSSIAEREDLLTLFNELKKSE
jgi:predicted Zn-dependent protease